MSYIVRVRRRKGVFYWSTSPYRPHEWHGPCLTAEAAEKEADDSVMNYEPTITGPGYPKPVGDHDPRPDLRRAAWALWPEMR